MEIGQASARKRDGFVDVDYRESDDRRGWNGGAFSLNRLRKGEDAQMEDAYYDEAAAYDGEGIVDASPALRIDGDADTAEQINRELKKLQDFRHPDIDTGSLVCRPWCRAIFPFGH